MTLRQAQGTFAVPFDRLRARDQGTESCSGGGFVADLQEVLLRRRFELDERDSEDGEGHGCTVVGTLADARCEGAVMITRCPS